MSFDITDLERILSDTDRVARVLVVDVAGSAPREAGAAMLVWKGGRSGTIGGGALEFEAEAAARNRLAANLHKPRLLRQPLGPGLGQCCGGSVLLLTEVYDGQHLQKIKGSLEASGEYARPVFEGGKTPPDTVLEPSTELARNRAAAKPVLKDGWIIEQLARSDRNIWVFGAGHVGRAIVSAVSPLPDFAITWVDVDAARFPEPIPGNVDRLVSVNPADAVAHAPRNAEHLILTYSHAFDLDICNRILAREFRFAGLIGSASKWARFRKRLIEFGHDPTQVDRIRCPIGDPSLGKHPWSIAVGVAACLIADGARDTTKAALP